MVWNLIQKVNEYTLSVPEGGHNQLIIFDTIRQNGRIWQNALTCQKRIRVRYPNKPGKNIFFETTLIFAGCVNIEGAEDDGIKRQWIKAYRNIHAISETMSFRSSFSILAEKGLKNVFKERSGIKTEVLQKYFKMDITSIDADNDGMVTFEEFWNKMIRLEREHGQQSVIAAVLFKITVEDNEELSNFRLQNWKKNEYL